MHTLLLWQYWWQRIASRKAWILMPGSSPSKRGRPDFLIATVLTVISLPVFFINANSCKYLFFHVCTLLSQAIGERLFPVSGSSCHTVLSSPFPISAFSLDRTVRVTYRLTHSPLARVSRKTLLIASAVYKIFVNRCIHLNIMFMIS